MNKFNKSSGSGSDKKRPFKSRDGAFKKDRKAGGDEKRSEGYKPKRTFSKDSGSGSGGYKGKSSSSSDKEKDFKKRPFTKDREERSFDKKSSRPYERKTAAGKSGDYKEKRPYKKREETGETEEKSYKAKRSFTKNKDFREKTFKKDSSDSFGSKGFERKKPFTKNDKYSDKGSFDKSEKSSRFSEKPERFDKDFKEKKSFGGKPLRKKFDSDADVKRVKYDDFEEGKTLGKYKKDFAAKGSKKAKSKSSESESGLTRLNKYLANAGIASRREADTLIKSGVVKVNGVPVTEMGFKVKPGDTVTYADSAVKSERKVYLLLNKPKDYITTMDDPQERNTVMDLVSDACKERIYPVGRLDRNTTGLLLLTNDGDLTKKLTHPKHNIKKVYHVTLNKGLKPEDFKSIIEGVELEDGVITADDLAFVGEGKKEVGIEIHSGRNRVVRRLFEQLGYDVLKLDRVVFAGLTKKDLPRGKHRFLTAKEISFLQMIG